MTDGIHQPFGGLPRHDRQKNAATADAQKGFPKSLKLSSVYVMSSQAMKLEWRPVGNAGREAEPRGKGDDAVVTG
jgi:hypothetical protein